ncbi:MAG: sulfur oxidation protein SoxY [Burkholderiaceae bacterium]|nr:sulfur oxidation protein SoxY [Burkholderiaceae bacterium]
MAGHTRRTGLFAGRDAGPRHARCDAGADRSLHPGAAPHPGKIELSLPEIVENGNSVSVTVRVASPMTDQEHVRRIAVFTEKNPHPDVLEIVLGPRAGRAQVSFRMRMADSQQISAVAELSDGSFWSATVDVVVALAACLE